MDTSLVVNLHLLAMLVWVGSMVAALLMLGRRGPAAIRRIFRAVATPAMIVTWLLGLYLAWRGGFFTQGWLYAKLVAVLALSALHGVALGRLRRIGPGGEVPGFLRVLPWIMLGLAVVAALLAARKPF